jgi:hypothetical protein
MTSTISNAKNWFSRNWFIPVAVVVAAGDLSSVYFGGWSDSELLEVALLFDFVVVIPLLYWWCYRNKGKAAVVQAFALACFAIWATSKVVPSEHHEILDSISWLRYVGLAGLLALEIKLGIVVYKAVVFSGQSKDDAQAKFESEGIPPWLAKFMAFEATLWRKTWLFIKRLFSKKAK